LERPIVLQAAVDHLSGNMTRSAVFLEKGTLFHALFAACTIYRQVTGFFEINAISPKGRGSCGVILASGHGIFNWFPVGGLDPSLIRLLFS
jgi:hypothetical protein